MERDQLSLVYIKQINIKHAYMKQASYFINRTEHLCRNIFVKIGQAAMRVGEMRFSGKMIICITRYPWNATWLELFNVICRGEPCLHLPSPFNCVNKISSSIIGFIYVRISNICYAYSTFVSCFEGLSWKISFLKHRQSRGPQARNDVYFRNTLWVVTIRRRKNAYHS